MPEEPKPTALPLEMRSRERDTGPKILAAAELSQTLRNQAIKETLGNNAEEILKFE